MGARAAVIVPHFNDHERLSRCLSALHENDLSDVEVVVVDNGSEPHPTEQASSFPGVRILTESEKGAAAARNRGVRETSADILMFLDADCVPSRNWVETGLRLMTGDTIVGGRIDVFDESDPPRTGAQAFEMVLAFNQRQYIEQKGFSATANLLTTRKVFTEVGGFKVGVSEDLEWCQRAERHGFHLAYADDLIVAHPSRGDWAALKKKWKRLTEETWALKREIPYARVRWICLACLMPVSAIAHTPRFLLSPRLSTTGERLRGVFTLFRLRFSRAVWMLQQAFGHSRLL